MYPPTKKLKLSHEEIGKLKSESGDKLKHCGEHNSVFCIFIEYFWDQNDGPYSGCKNIEFTDWLVSNDIDTNDKFWYFSNKLDIRISKKFELTESLKINEDFLVNAATTNKNRICAKIAYALRKILPILMNCKNNVNYTNDKGRTLLHIFIEEYLIIKQDFSSEEIFRIQKLVERLVKMDASFYIQDEQKKTPIHIGAMCKSEKILEVIISSLTNINARDTDGNTALHIILDNCLDQENNHKRHYKHIVKILIANGAEVNVQNNQGITPMHLSSEKFNVEILKFLAENGANSCQRTNDGKSPLEFACKSTLTLKDCSIMVDTINFFVAAGCDFKAVDEEGYTLLHHAAEFANLAIVERLIELGIDVDSRTIKMQLTPLYFAAKGNRFDNIKALIKAGADVNAEAVDGSSPLFMSILWGTYETINYLIDAGANIYQRDNVIGFTPFHLAACEPDSKLGRFENSPRTNDTEKEDERKPRKLDAFIDKNFDVNDAAMCNVFALELATVKGNFHNVKNLIERGAKVHIQNDPSQMTALHLSVVSNNLHVAEILIENGADVNCRCGSEKWTPLHMILAKELKWHLGKYPANVKEYKNTLHYRQIHWPKSSITAIPSFKRFVTLFLENHADVNAKDSMGRTALHLAASLCGIYSAIPKLLEAGATVNLPDHTGELPIHNIVKQNNVEKFKMLLKFGADINDDDTSELIMNSSVGIKNAAIQQSIKINLLGLYIANVYKPLIEAPEFADFHKECLQEIQNLIKYDINRYSLYDFLKMCSQRQCFYAPKILESYDHLKKNFPIYSDLIRSACCESSNRKLLLHSARIAWSKVMMPIIRLPELCIHQCLKHLNNRYLEMFSMNGDEDEKIIVDDEANYVFNGTCTICC